MGLTCGPPGSCRPQVGPLLAPRTLLSGIHLQSKWKEHCRMDTEQVNTSVPRTYTNFINNVQSGDVIMRSSISLHSALQRQKQKLNGYIIYTRQSITRSHGQKTILFDIIHNRNKNCKGTHVQDVPMVPTNPVYLTGSLWFEFIPFRVNINVFFWALIKR